MSEPVPAKEEEQAALLTRVRDAKLAVDRAHAEAWPTKAGRSGALARALTVLGDALCGIGNLTDAVLAYRECRAILDVLGTSSADSLLDLSSCLRRLGESLAAQGDLDGAAAVLRDEVAVRRRLSTAASCATASETGARGAISARREVERSVQRLGDVVMLKSKLCDQPSPATDGHRLGLRLTRLKAIAGEFQARGDYASALAVYRHCVSAWRTLVASHPDIEALSLDLSWALGTLGRAQSAQGDLKASFRSLTEALDIRGTLAARNPSHTARRLDLSFSLMALWEVAAAMGDLEAAQCAFREALTLRRTLSEVDPHNQGLRRDSAVSLVRIGDVLANSDAAAAVAAYQEAAAIMRATAAADAEETSQASDLASLIDRIAALSATGANAQSGGG
jgi:tetratricopeptide (TPR) repeat protein